MTLWGDRDHFFAPKFNFGGAKRSEIYGFEYNQEVYQQMFKGDPSFTDQGKEGSTFYITEAARQSRNARDYAMDISNPRDQLTPSQVDLKNINAIPPFNKEMPDLSTPEDYKPHDQVRLVQDATQHYLEQKDFFTDPKMFEKTYLNTDAVGTPQRGVSQRSLYFMRGNMAGREDYHLEDAPSGTNLSAMESISVF